MKKLLFTLIFCCANNLVADANEDLLNAVMNTQLCRIENRPAEACIDLALKKIRQALKNGADVNFHGESGMTALILASHDDQNLRITQELIKHSANINEKNDFGYTPLMVAVAQNQPATVAALLNAGADVNARDNNGGTALMVAALYGNLNIIQKLLKYEADVHAQDKQGNSILAYAKQPLNGEEVIALLKKHGAR